MRLVILFSLSYSLISFSYSPFLLLSLSGGRPSPSPISFSIYWMNRTSSWVLLSITCIWINAAARASASSGNGWISAFFCLDGEYLIRTYSRLNLQRTITVRGRSGVYPKMCDTVLCASGGCRRIAKNCLCIEPPPQQILPMKNLL